MGGGHQLVYQVYLCLGFFDHSDHWVDNVELDLNNKPQSFQRPGGLKVEAGTEVEQAAEKSGREGLGRESLDPHPPPSSLSFRILTCNSTALNNS